MFIPPKKNGFGGYTGIRLSVRPFVSLSVCVQNGSFCQSAGRGIKSDLVRAPVLHLLHVPKQFLDAIHTLNPENICMRHWENRYVYMVMTKTVL